MISTGPFLRVDLSKFVEHEEGSADEAAEGYSVVPVKPFAKVVDGEDSEDA